MEEVGEALGVRAAMPPPFFCNLAWGRDGMAGLDQGCGMGACCRTRDGANPTSFGAGLASAPRPFPLKKMILAGPLTLSPLRRISPRLRQQAPWPQYSKASAAQESKFQVTLLGKGNPRGPDRFLIPEEFQGFRAHFSLSIGAAIRKGELPGTPST